MCLYCYLCILTQVSLVKTIPSSFTKQVCVLEALWGQTERPDFGTEKGLLQGQAKRTGDTCPQTPNASKVFGEKYVYRQNSQRRLQVCYCPLIGEWWGNRAVLQESVIQPEVTIFHLGAGLGGGLCVYSVTQLCPILCNPVDCSPPGFSVHGIFLARILEWVAIFSSRRSSQPGNAKPMSAALAGRFIESPM